MRLITYSLAMLLLVMSCRNDKNDARTPDTQNEWYYDSTTKKIKIYKVYDCNKEIKEEHVGFMQQGGILDKYDNGRVFVSIVHVVDPKDWQYNEYFTGNGFSKNEDE